MSLRRSLLLGLWVSVAACGDRAAPAPPYELLCDSSDTRQSSSLFCVRHDTRDGDVKRVNLDAIPRSQGPTAAAAGPPGTYQLECDATSTEDRSDFFCVRLNRNTGELLLVTLPKTEQIPP